MLRTVAICAACLLVPVASASACAGAGTAPTPETLARAKSATLCLINAARSEHGLPPLGATASLARAATAHSRDMTARDFFAHATPGGLTPAKRIGRAGYLAGISTWTVGETIAWGRGSSASPAAIVRSWLKSPAHRAILLDARYQDVGIGIAPGVPQGGGGATFTGDFGARGVR
ncbi:MAG TPA: CAP domain-containing protein [Solirubrobacteraceae bacterium]